LELCTLPAATFVGGSRSFLRWLVFVGEKTKVVEVGGY
jgi:hypothetical protein